MHVSSGFYKLPIASVLVEGVARTIGTALTGRYKTHDFTERYHSYIHTWCNERCLEVLSHHIKQESSCNEMHINDIMLYKCNCLHLKLDMQI